MPYKDKQQMKEYLRNSYELRKKFIEAMKDVPCKDCGQRYPSYVMDFDHLYDKEFTISRFKANKGLDTLAKEILKCDVVCSNCHRVRTFNRQTSVAQ